MRTPAGRATWQPVQVSRLLEALLGVIRLRSSYINARSMRFVVGDRLSAHRYVQSLWNAHPNGQQPFAAHARMSLS